MRSTQAELDFQHTLLDGITERYARDLAAAWLAISVPVSPRPEGEGSEVRVDPVADILRRIEAANSLGANYIDPVAVGHLAVLFILSQSK